MPRRLNAIATTYGQTQYKSRLEARFAEFLTRRGEPFEYEPVIRAAGGTYIGDFYLPRRHRYVEIKPRECRDELQMHARTLLASRAPVLVVDSPRRGEFVAYENFNVVEPGQWTQGPGRHWMPPDAGPRPARRVPGWALLIALGVAAAAFWARPHPTAAPQTPQAPLIGATPAAPENHRHHPHHRRRR